MKRILSALLILFMIMTILSTPVLIFAQNDLNENELLGDAAESLDILSSYNCTYSPDTKKINISGTVRHSAFSVYNQHSLLIFPVPAGASEYDIALDNNSEPLVDVSVSMNFEFAFNANKSSDRYSKYAIFLRSPEGELTLAAHSKFPTVVANKNNDNKDNFKGINIDVKSFSSMTDAGTVIIPVYFDELYIDTNNGYEYQTASQKLFFNKSYVDELDASVRSAGISGATVYLQLLLRENSKFASVEMGDFEYILPDVYNENTMMYLHSAVDFISQRYYSDCQLGFILGKGWDNYLKYNHCTVSSLEEYVERCSFYAILVSNAARSVSPDISIVLPFTGDNFISGEGITVKENCFSVNDIIISLSAKLKDCLDSNLYCSVLLETDKTPLNISNENILSGIDISSKETVEGLAAGNQGSFSEFFEEISLKYNGMFDEYIFSWKPISTLTGNALAAAYAYSYYELLQDDMVSSFVVEFSNDNFSTETVNDLTHIFKYIDTSYGKDTTKNLLTYFGATSWEEVIGVTEGSIVQNKQLHVLIPKYELPTDFKGKFAYFDFSKALLGHGWTCGSNCKNTKIELSKNQIKSLKADINTQNNSVAELVYQYEYHENMAYTPYLDFPIMIEDELGNYMYEVTIVIENGNERFETSCPVASNTNVNIGLDLSEYSNFGMVDNIKIFVRSLEQNPSSAKLWLYGISGYSTQYTDDELKSLISKEREKNENVYSATQEAISYRSVVIAAAIIVISAALITFVTYSFRRSSRNASKQEDD